MKKKEEELDERRKNLWYYLSLVLPIFGITYLCEKIECSFYKIHPASGVSWTQLLLKIFYFTYYYKLSQICHLMGHRWSLCDSWVMRTGVKETVVSIVVNSWAPAAPHSQHLLGHCQYYKNCEHLWWYCHTFIKRLWKRCHNFKTLPQKWWFPLWWNTVMKNWQVIYIYIYIFHMKNYETNYEGNVKKMDTLSTSSLQCQHIPGL